MASKIKVDQIDTTLGTGNVTIDPDNNTLVVDTDNGYVGIGTASPVNQLHLSSSGANYATLRLTAPDNTTPGNFQLRSHDGVFDIRDATNAATRVTLDASGNVGIGTESPDFPLEVYAATTSEVAIGSDNGGTAQLSFYENNSSTKEGFIKYDGTNNKIVIGTSAKANAFEIDRDEGIFQGQSLFNGTPSFGPANTWTSSGQSLSSYPNGSTFFITATMQNLGTYTAAMLVYKTSNGQYFEMANKYVNLLQIRLNGATIEMFQQSGANQTGSAGNMRIFYGPGMRTI